MTNIEKNLATYDFLDRNGKKKLNKSTDFAFIWKFGLCSVKVFMEIFHFWFFPKRL